MNIIKKINQFSLYPLVNNDLILLVYRILISLELIIVHGLKKIGVETSSAENIPNPFNFPEWFNESFAIAANIIFPLFVIIGLYTRIAVIPILAVTLSGYFVVHWNDPLLIKDVPFMYSLSFLLIAFLGPGKYSIDNFLKFREL